MSQIVHLVKFKPLDNAKPVAQRRRQQTRTGGCAHEGKRWQIELDRTRSGTFADHNIELIVLHRWIEHFLYKGTEPVDLIDEQHITRLEVGHKRSDIAGLFQYRSASGLERNTHLVRNDAGQSGLTQTRRPKNECVIQRLAAPTRRGQKNIHLLAYGSLTQILGQRFGSDRAVNLLVGAGPALGGDETVGFNSHQRSCSLSALTRSRSPQRSTDQFLTRIDIVIINGSHPARGFGKLVTQRHQRLFCLAAIVRWRSNHGC